jgi:hypothetical protein
MSPTGVFLLSLQVGFVVCVEGGRLGAHLEEALPDFAFAFEGGGAEVGSSWCHCCDRGGALGAVPG